MQADIIYAYEEVGSIIELLVRMRGESEQVFKTIFSEATKLGKQLYGSDFELIRPRISGRQVHRSNIETSSTEDYYRITYYNEFLSHVTTELKLRFMNTPPHGMGLLHLLPTKCREAIDVDVPAVLSEAVAFYSEDLPHPTIFSTEYRMWVRKWKQLHSDIPTKMVDALQACDLSVFPNVHILLQLALTIPITSCESERSFSQLKLVKSSHRSTMTSERLSGLTLMKINRIRCEQLESPLKMSKLVKTFEQLHPRRMKLPMCSL